MLDDKKKNAYRKILKQERAVNPPYLTVAGWSVLAIVFLMGLFACIFHVLQQPELVVFLATIFACTLGFLALDYAVSLLSWRAFRSRLLSLSVHVDASHVVSGRQFVIELEVCNRLPWRVCVEALCWDCTAHIRIADALDGVYALGAGSQYCLRFQAEGVRFGNGRILGVALLMTDLLRLFRYEVHIEQNRPVRVFPERVSRAKLASFLARSGMGRRGRSAHESEDLEGIRPFVSGDRLKHIVWRGYAKRQELEVYRRARLAHRRIVMLVDAGPQMRVFGADAPCGLMRVHAWIARLAGAFDEVAVIACDECGGEWIAKNVYPPKAVTMFETWLFGRLAQQPEDWSVPAWSEAVNALYADFKVYRRVDFSKYVKGRKLIDLDGLLEYARAQWAEELLAAGQYEAASGMMKMPFDKVLRRLISERCDMAKDSLDPDPPALRLDKAWPMLQAYLDGHPGIPILWFSCFSSPASEPLLREISAAVAGRHDLVCVELPMPEFALNFSAREGEAHREAYRKCLGRSVKFMTI